MVNTFCHQHVNLVHSWNMFCILTIIIIFIKTKSRLHNINLKHCLNKISAQQNKMH